MAICPFGVVLRRDSWQRANPHDFGRIAFASERVVLAAGYLPPRAPLGNSPTGNLRSNIVLLVHGLSLKKKAPVRDRGSTVCPHDAAGERNRHTLFNTVSVHPDSRNGAGGAGRIFDAAWQISFMRD
jgi:hypothetical protein